MEAGSFKDKPETIGITQMKHDIILKWGKGIKRRKTSQNTIEGGSNGCVDRVDFGASMGWTCLQYLNK